MKYTIYHNEHTPTVHRGKSYVTKESMIGKLSFWKKGRVQASQKGATIVVLTSNTEGEYLAADDASSTVALVFIGEAPSDALCAHAIAHELPLLILSTFSPRADGRSAILDSRTATLFVDPSLDTLARYARNLRFCADPAWNTLSPLLSPPYDMLPLDTPFSAHHNMKLLPLCERGPLTLSHGEEPLFEALRTLAEETIGLSLILGVRVYDTVSEQGLTALRERLRACLRAAVFGSFSLLFEGLYNASSVCATFDLFDGVRRELTEEKREFDDRVAYGIAVESPILLHELPLCPPTMDFLCLDMDRLLRATLPPFAGKTPPIEAKESFLALVREETARTPIPVCARTVHTPTMVAWTPSELRGCGVRACFVPNEHLFAWREWKNEGEKTKK